MIDAYTRVSQVLTQPVWLISYLIGIAVLAFHLNHGFASAFQTLGLRHRKYTPIIQFLGKAFSQVPSLSVMTPSKFHTSGTGVLAGSISRRKFFKTWYINSCASRYAIFLPKHSLGPMPNGSQVPGMILCLFAGLNRSGSNFSGSSQYFGSF